MILSYSLRLLCLCLASFFLLNAGLGLAVWLATPPAIRRAKMMRPRMGARLLLSLRMLPMLLAGILVLGVGLPSYFWLEPWAAGERVGVICSTAALFGLAIWCFSIARSLRLILRSRRYESRCERAGEEIPAQGPVRMVALEVEHPVIALAGVFRPTVWVSRSVIEALSAEEFDTAVRHEIAHSVSRDNLKRLLFRLAPDTLPMMPSLAALEGAWVRISEWAADDDATRGDAHRSVLLAMALVRVARLGAAAPAAVLSTPLIAGDLSARVDRLLRTKQPAPTTTTRRPGMGLGIVAVVTGLAVAAVQWAAILHSAHALLEQLVR